MPSSPQVKRTGEDCEKPQWTILTFTSIQARNKFYSRYNDQYLANQGITGQGKPLKCREVPQRCNESRGANQSFPARGRDSRHSASSAVGRDLNGRGGEGQCMVNDPFGDASYNREGAANEAPNHHCNSGNASPGQDISHSDASSYTRSTPIWEHGIPQSIQPTALRTPNVPQQTPPTARPLSNGCPAASIVGPGVTPAAYFGSGYDVLWWMGLGAVCISRIR